MRAFSHICDHFCRQDVYNECNPSRRGVLQTIRIMTRERDYYTSLVRLAIPVALQGLITFLVSFADNLMVNSLGDGAVSGVYRWLMNPTRNHEVVGSLPDLLSGLRIWYCCE